MKRTREYLSAAGTSASVSPSTTLIDLTQQEHEDDEQAPESLQSQGTSWMKGMFGIPPVDSTCYVDLDDDQWKYEPVLTPRHVDSVLAAPIFEQRDAQDTHYFPHDDPDLYPPRNHPQPSPYEWHQHPTDEYHSGQIYLHQVDPSKVNLLGQKLKRVAQHPALAPRRTERDGKVEWVGDSVPGQVSLVPGVPFVQQSLDNRNLRETAVVYHTMESLAEFPEAIRGPLLANIKALQDLFFPPADGVPFYQLGWRRNLRSGVMNVLAGIFSGSYSLASTVEQGNGVGIVRPALQTTNPDTDAVRYKLLNLLGQIVVTVLKLSISKLEFETLLHAGRMAHIPGFGTGTNVFFPSVQMNVSTIRESIEVALGTDQGRIHSDMGDAVVSYTVFMVMLKCHSDDFPGGFQFPQHGLYVRHPQTGEGLACYFFVFKGRSLHGAIEPRSGSVVSADGEVDEVLNYDACSVRAGLVSYCSSAALDRQVPLRFGPHTQFGPNPTTPWRHDLPDFVHNSAPIMGPKLSQQYLMEELVMGMHNMAVFAGIKPPSPEGLLKMWFASNDGQDTSTEDISQLYDPSNTSHLTVWAERFKFMTDTAVQFLPTLPNNTTMRKAAERRKHKEVYQGQQRFQFSVPVSGDDSGSEQTCTRDQSLQQTTSSRKRPNSDSAARDNEGSPVKKKKRHTQGSAPSPPQDVPTKAKEKSAEERMSLNIERIRTCLESSSFDDELTHLKAFLSTAAAPTEKFSGKDLEHALAVTRDYWSFRQDNVNTLDVFSQGTPVRWSADVTSVVGQNLQWGSKLYPSTRKMTVSCGWLEQCMVYHCCQVLVDIFQWHLRLGPELAGVMFEAVVKSKDFQLADVLKTGVVPPTALKGLDVDLCGFEPVVKFIFDHLYRCSASLPPIPVDKETRSALLSTMGLGDRTNETGEFCLGAKHIRVNAASPQSIKKAFTSSFTEATIRLVFFSDMKQLSKVLDIQDEEPGPRGAKNDSNKDWEHLQNLTVLRGAVLSVFRSKLGDGFFWTMSAKGLLKQIIGNPANLLGIRPKRAKEVSPSDSTTSLNTLAKFLDDLVKNRPQVAENIRLLGEKYNTLQLLVRGHSGKERKTSSSSKEVSPTMLGTYDASPDLKENVQTGTIRMDLVCCMVGESLLAAKHTKNGVQVYTDGTAGKLNRLLNGRKMGCGNSVNKMHGRDHYDPCKVQHGRFKLFKEVLPLGRLTSEMGLSNLLLFYGTGQSLQTAEFTRQLPTFFHTYDQAISKFTNEHGASPKYDIHAFGRLDSLLEFSAEKAELWFDDSVRNQWKEFLGDRLDKNASSDFTPIEWAEMFNFIRSLNLDGFQSGLAGFQLVNDTYLVGLVAAPTLQNISNYIATETQKRAYKGLVALGFDLSEISQSGVETSVKTRYIASALQVIYEKLDKMSEEDKKLFHLDWVVVENLCCKASTWINAGKPISEGSKQGDHLGVLEYIKDLHERKCLSYDILPFDIE